MPATIAVGPGWDIKAIIAAAGGNPELSILRGASLICPDLDQAALEGGVAAYDHLANCRARVAKLIRLHAESVVNQYYTLGYQSRAASRMITLLEKKAGYVGSAPAAWTGGEEAEATAYRAYRVWIESVWTNAALIEADVVALTTAEAVLAVNWQGDSRWPAPPA